MRQTTVVLLVAMFITSPVQAREKPPPTFCYLDSLEAGLAGFFCSDSVVMASVQAVQKRMPLYRQWQAEARRRGPRLLGRLDIITKSHFESRMSTDEYLILTYSQWRIRQLLDSLHCDLIGTEGFDAERMTLSDLESLVIHQMNALSWGFGVDTLRAQLIAIRWVSTNNGLYHLKTHPRSRCIGWEDEDLHRLNALLSIRFSRLPRWLMPDSSESRLFFLAASARSEIAVIRMIRTMARDNRYHGVIVIGAGHASEMLALLRKYSVRGVMFDTVEPPHRLPSDWWK